MFWSVKMRLPLNLVELTYFYGGGWGGRGQGMGDVPSSKMNKILFASDEPEEEMRRNM